MGILKKNIHPQKLNQTHSPRTRFIRLHRVSDNSIIQPNNQYVCTISVSDRSLGVSVFKPAATTGQAEGPIYRAIAHFVPVTW